MYSKRNARRNDVFELNDAILTEGCSGCVPVYRNRTFQLDYSRFMQLITDTYIDFLGRDRKLQQYLSLSQYTYYCVILLWKRLGYVISSRGTDLEKYRSLTDLPDMCIPEKIGYYLSGIGNITDYNGVQSYLSIQASPSANAILGVSGHYGKIDHLSHINYETLPSPYVAVLRMLYDLAFTESSHQQLKMHEEWDLPNELRPNGDFIINKNLLGWFPAVSLSENQLRLCNKSGLSAKIQLIDGIPVPTFDTHGIRNIMGLPIIDNLLSSISSLLAGSTVKKTAETKSYLGSLAVSGFTVADYVGECGSKPIPIYQRPCSGYSYFPASAYMASAIVSFRYRVERFTNNVKQTLCYTGHQGEVPQGWVDTANLIFNSCPSWNSKNFVCYG